MALVCDIKSNSAEEEESPDKKEEIDLEDGEIEDDEEDATESIEDVAAAEPPNSDVPTIPPATPEKIKAPSEAGEKGKDRTRDRSDRPERRRHEDKGKKHMTEAEKSILHLRKREEMQRKKWEKINRLKDMEPEPDDFAKNIEKTLATILNKKEKEAAAVSGGEDKEKDKDEPRRGRKRKKHDKERKEKHRRLESPKSEIDENEMLNMRTESPERRFLDEKGQPSPVFNSEESVDSEYSSDINKTDDRSRRNRDFRKANRKNRDRDHHGRTKKRERDRDKKSNEQQEPMKDSQGICIFYLQGKCLKTECPYSHEAVPPMKLELCKFYIMDCCAKGDKCSYMHSEFPCKFYHTGLSCAQGDNCKFAHGKPLSEGLKQTLFKHIETAPRDLLGGFPRMSREEALNLINQTQMKLQEQHGMVQENKEGSKGGIPSLFDINVPIPPELLQGLDGGKIDKTNRQRPSRWQDMDNGDGNEAPFPLKPFNYGQDQDMRINSNGDVDMRTLPPPLATPPILQGLHKNNHMTDNNDVDIEKYKREAGVLGVQSVSNFDFQHGSQLPYSRQDIDIRSQPPPLLSSKDVDIRQLPNIFNTPPPFKKDVDELKRQIDSGDDRKDNLPDLPAHLPKTQRDLFLRIQSHQKENLVETEKQDDHNNLAENINWYSDDDDDDDNRLTIKVDNEEIKDKEELLDKPNTGTTLFGSLLSPPTIKPLEVVEKLGDLSKIDISAEVTKILSSMSQSRNQSLPTVSAPEKSSIVRVDTPASTPPPASSDPRPSRPDPRKATEKTEPARTDPRLQPASTKQRSRQSSTDNQRTEKVSIYEQGSIDRNTSDEADVNTRGMRSDVDLRNLHLPFKGMQNYTPCSEIDASINSHPPISWKVVIVDIPRPDYTGLKLSINDAEKTGDPRLRKIFRLSTEERDTPLSPKASPKAGTSVRVDPRLRKMDENKPDPQGDTMSFLQQLTALQSSAFYQSLTSNQKLLLNQGLNKRNESNSHDPVLHALLSNLNIIPTTQPSSNIIMGAARSILSNISKLDPMMVQQQNLPMNPTILGQMAQSISQPGLLGAAPGIPNLPPDFQINFDPRNGGLLGNAPPMPPFGGFPQPDNLGNFNNYNDDYYPQEGGNVGNYQGNNRDNRGFNRERRRGRNFGGNRGNRNFRHNRNNNRINRHHSPP